jgi:L-malate glycosyltransferase
MGECREMNRGTREGRDRLRVAFCIDNMGIGGTELNAVRTAEGLPSELVDLRVVTWNGEGPLTERYQQAGIPISVFSLRSFKSPDALRQGIRLLRWLRREKIQVVHAHDIYSNIFAVPWARMAGVPFVVASRRFGKSGESLLAASNRRANRLAHRVIANSTRGADHLRREGVPEERIRVLPNFLEDSAFDLPTSQERERLLESLGLPRAARVVGIVANLSPLKDHLTLVRSFKAISEQFPDWVLVGFGEGSERTGIEVLVRDLELEHRVSFPGIRGNRPNLHGFFDISTLVSPDEGSPNSLLEAMAAGRPIVATNVGGIPDLVEDRVNGILVPPGDPPSLANALRELMRDAETRRQMGDLGQRRAQERHSQRSVLDELIGFYLEGAGRGLEKMTTSEVLP